MSMACSPDKGKNTTTFKHQVIRTICFFSTKRIPQTGAIINIRNFILLITPKYFETPE